MASLVFNVFVVVACVCICLSTALPSKKDSYGTSAKKATTTTTKAPKPKCDTVCSDDYTPLCANEKGSTADKAKSFGNECVMNKFNCEHGTNLVKEADGECKNGSGIRLA